MHTHLCIWHKRDDDGKRLKEKKRWAIFHLWLLGILQTHSPWGSTVSGEGKNGSMSAKRGANIRIHIHASWVALHYRDFQ